MQEGEGLTTAQATTSTFSKTSFKNNQLIEHFDEFKYFIKMNTQNTDIGELFSGCSNLISTDLTNLTVLFYGICRNCNSLMRFNGEDEPEYTLNLPNLKQTYNNTAEYVFAYCTLLKHVTSLGIVPRLEESTFKGCTNLEDVTLPNQCIYLRGYCFQDCSKLSVINISQLTTLSYSVFQGCTMLEYYDGPNSTRGELNLPNLTGRLSYDAFYGCKKLTSIASLGSITSIENSAFENCTNLATVNLPNTVTYIGNNAFANCTSLATINFPNTITSIGANAFANTAWYNSQPNGEVIICSCLYKYKGTVVGTYTIPSNITNVSPSCFYGQASLTGITSWPSSQKTIPSACFQNSGLESFDLTGIVTIENNAFRSSKLISIVIPNSITTLNDDCFAGCLNLASITIGTGITHLGRNIFSSCLSLETLVIPANVKSLERDTLTGCSSLQWVRLESTTMVSLFSADCFANTNNCIIYVPSDLVDTYKADSKWSSLSSRIQAIST